ncbi:hypothetical protein MAM1_0030c02343 [Mucor ambiguus]|uniref:Uncharacterized protein n=1 Tax=Mucor ambiguus TaxID=91626 RepID=A0A0C9MLY3_9FUNG|nr:hypothetical protein MAM1_0030c02343 [Mucor ambiguus]
MEMEISTMGRVHHEYTNLKPPEKPIKKIKEDGLKQEDGAAEPEQPKRTRYRSYKSEDKTKFFFLVYEKQMSVRAACKLQLIRLDILLLLCTLPHSTRLSRLSCLSSASPVISLWSGLSGLSQALSCTTVSIGAAVHYCNDGILSPYHGKKINTWCLPL